MGNEHPDAQWRMCQHTLKTNEYMHTVAGLPSHTGDNRAPITGYTNTMDGDHAHTIVHIHTHVGDAIMLIDTH